MALYNLPQNTTDPAQLSVAVSSASPRLFPLILLMIYLVIALGGYLSEERQKSKGKLSFWLTVAGLITTTISFVLFLIDGIIGLEIIIVCMAITFVSGLFYFVATKESTSAE